MRTAIAATSLCLSLSGRSEADPVGAASRQDTRIPPEALSAALLTLEKDRNVEVIFLAEDVRNVRTKGATGSLTLAEALNQLLIGTKLTYHIDRESVTIVPAESPHTGNGSSGRAPVLEPAALDQVVVTARKRKEDPRNVPSSISVVGADELQEWGATQLADYAAYTPGLTVVQGAVPGTDMLVLRGLSSAAPTALVGTYIDDTPVGGSSAWQPAARFALDLLPYDLERLEVLEGPQGTLYGANTMGGLLKYVMRKPDLDDTVVRVGADLKENGNLSATGGAVRGSVNLPIAPGRAALRLSASEDLTPGFIDEPDQARTNGNAVSRQSGHAAGLFKLADNWSVDISGLVQHLHASDGATSTLTAATFAPDSGRLSDSRQLGQSFDSRLQYSSATLNGELGWATFDSTTGYSSSRSTEWAQLYYPLDRLTGRAVGGLQLSLDELTQELRLASPTGGRFEWLLGAFFSSERGDEVESAEALDTANRVLSDPQVNPESVISIPSHYREYALFGDATWGFTEHFSLTAGLRESHNEQSFVGEPTCSAAYVSTVGPCQPVGEGASAQNVFNFAVSPRYRFSPDVMVYIRVASGYRPGGPNTPAPGVPGNVAADTLIESEAGLKAAWLDRKLRVDAAVYQIDWNQIQITELAPPPSDITYGANGNTATVRGLEATTLATLRSDVSVGLSLAYTNAELSAPMPANSKLVGTRGNRLPYAPLWSGSFTADYLPVLPGGWKGALGADWHYTGQRYTTIDNPGNCPTNCAGASSVPSLRPYGVFDLHAGMSNPRWSVRFTVRNLTNKYELVDLSGSNSPSFDVAPILATVLSGRLFTLGFDRTL